MPRFIDITGQKWFTRNGDMSEFSIFLAGMLAVAMTLGAIGAASTPTPNSTTLLSAVSAEGGLE